MSDLSWLDALTPSGCDCGGGGSGTSGKDGAVYVPHIDARKILTFTLEEKPGKIPDPVDLNPNDDWGEIGDSDTIRSEYVWEEM